MNKKVYKSSQTTREHFLNQVINKKFLLISLVILFSVLIRLINLNVMGRTMDEDYIVEKGNKFVEMAVHGDFANPYWYSMPDHPPLGNYLYGVVSYFDITGFNPHTEALDMEYRGVPTFAYDLTYSRLLSVVMSAITILLVCLIGWRYFSPFVSITAGIILSTNPFYLGISQLVFLETPFILFFTATMYAFLRYLEHPSYKIAMVTGILLGCTLDIKQTAILLFPTILGMYIFNYSFFRKEFTLLNHKHLGVIFLMGVLVSILVWPMPWFHLPEYLKFTYNMWLTGHGYPERFLGRVMITPIFYYVVYFIISIPVLFLLSFTEGVRTILFGKHWIMYTLLLWFVIPFAGQSLFNLRQHQLRYVIEMYAPYSLIAAIGIEQVVKRFPSVKGIKVLTVLLLSLYVLLILFKSTPYYLDYFNGIVGGTKTVYDTKWFQLGWGGQGEREAGVYLEKHAQKGDSVGLSLDPIKNIKRVEGIEYSVYDPNNTYDWVVVNYYIVIRSNFNEEPIKKKYRLVYTVYADGAQLAHVYKKLGAK